jgi:RNA polymerase sigma-70 factor, ECF subfamily
MWPSRPPPMMEQTIATDKTSRECFAAAQFLDNPNSESFAVLFKVFNPQLLSFFRSRTREFSSAEDLAQEVMLTVYAKAGQIRDRTLFRGWLFKIAHNALCRHYAKLTREVETVNLADVEHLVAAHEKAAGSPAFEFRDWVTLLDAREREAMLLRFVEEWEYHEIAAAQAIPIGTVQWRIFNCKKKLTNLLTSRQATHATRTGWNHQKQNSNASAVTTRSKPRKKKGDFRSQSQDGCGSPRMTRTVSRAISSSSSVGIA